jgi:hypothetical protein
MAMPAPPKGVTSVILDQFASTPLSMKLLSPFRAPFARISWLPAPRWVASTISVFVPAVRPRISMKLRLTSGSESIVSRSITHPSWILSLKQKRLGANCDLFLCAADLKLKLKPGHLRDSN